jgi:hypothetical protein
MADSLNRFAMLPDAVQGVRRLAALALLCVSCSAAIAVADTYHFPGSLRQPINVKVVEARPAVETVYDAKFPDGYAYSTFGAEKQLENFALEIGGHLVQGRAVPAYSNLNKNDPPNSSGLLFTFTLKHWYSRFPLNAFAGRSPVVLVEGEFETDLSITAGDTVLYTRTYSTKGNKTFAALDIASRRDIPKFIDANLDAKGNEVLVRVLGEIIPDLEKQWSAIAAKEQP